MNEQKYLVFILEFGEIHIQIWHDNFSTQPDSPDYLRNKWGQILKKIPITDEESELPISVLEWRYKDALEEAKSSSAT